MLSESHESHASEGLRVAQADGFAHGAAKQLHQTTGGASIYERQLHLLARPADVAAFESASLSNGATAGR